MILCTHEEIAVGIANGYARVTGEIMATGLHDIVGLQHASMNLFNAWCDRTPIFNLGGGGPLNSTNRRSTDWVHTALIQAIWFASSSSMTINRIQSKPCRNLFSRPIVSR